MNNIKKSKKVFFVSLSLILFKHLFVFLSDWAYRNKSQLDTFYFYRQYTIINLSYFFMGMLLISILNMFKLLNMVYANARIRKILIVTMVVVVCYMEMVLLIPYMDILNLYNFIIKNSFLLFFFLGTITSFIIINVATKKL